MVAGDAQHVAAAQRVAEMPRHQQPKAVALDRGQVADRDTPLHRQDHQTDPRALFRAGQPLTEQALERMAIRQARQHIDVAARRAAGPARQQLLRKEGGNAPGERVDRKQDVHFQPVGGRTVARQVSRRRLDQRGTGVEREARLGTGIDTTDPTRMDPREPRLGLGPGCAGRQFTAESGLGLLATAGGHRAVRDLCQAGGESTGEIGRRDDPRERPDRSHLRSADTMAGKRLSERRAVRLRVGAGPHPR